MSLTEAERAAVLERARELGARYGIDWRNIPGVKELLDGDGGAARGKLEKKQAFADKFGLRVADVPDSALFDDEVQGE